MTKEGLEGYEAFIQGLCAEENPYSPLEHPEAFYDWLQGWLDSEGVEGILLLNARESQAAYALGVKAETEGKDLRFLTPQRRFIEDAEAMLWFIKNRLTNL